MAKTAALKITKQGGVYHLSGHINEKADFSELRTAAEDIVHVNLGKVDQINSFGIRNLLDVFYHLRDKKIVYHDCCPEFINFLNLIPSTLGPATSDTGRIESLYIPYTCDSCKNEQLLWAKLTDLVATIKATGKMEAPCPKCGAMMEGDSPDYIAFAFPKCRSGH